MTFFSCTLALVITISDFECCHQLLGEIHTLVPILHWEVQAIEQSQLEKNESPEIIINDPKRAIWINFVLLRNILP